MSENTPTPTDPNPCGDDCCGDCVMWAERLAAAESRALAAERDRDAFEAETQRLLTAQEAASSALETMRARVGALATELDETAAAYDAHSERPTKNDDERRTALANFVAAIALRDAAKSIRAALASPSTPASDAVAALASAALTTEVRKANERPVPPGLRPFCLECGERNGPAHKCPPRPPGPPGIYCGWCGGYFRATEAHRHGEDRCAPAAPDAAPEDAP